MLIRIYTDGASRGNPGKSASGYAFFNSNGQLLGKKTEYNGVATNNVAEYKAVINALKMVKERFGTENDLKLFSDSKLIVNQIAGRYKVRDKKLKELNAEATALLGEFSSYQMHDVPRENAGISSVDKELNIFLDNV